MERWDVIFKGLVTAGGAAASFLFGGWSALLGILAAFVVADYITGLMAAGVEKKLSSEVGLKGITKKVCIFILVAAAYMVDKALGAAQLFRDATIFFYLANELLSIIENAGRIGLPVPDIIGQAVVVLRGKSKDGGSQ